MSNKNNSSINNRVPQQTGIQHSGNNNYNQQNNMTNNTNNNLNSSK